MRKAYRHGEIAFIETKAIPKLVENKTKVLAKGSHGNDHTFDNGKFYLLEEHQDFVIGYFVAKDTKLFHPEHSPYGCDLPNGKYEVRKQQEYTPSGLVYVSD